MTKHKPLAEKVYDPGRDQTHYVGRGLLATLCGLKQPDLDQALPTDALVDCQSCVAFVQYVKTHKFDEPGQTRHGKD